MMNGKQIDSMEEVKNYLTTFFKKKPSSLHRKGNSKADKMLEIVGIIFD